MIKLKEILTEKKEFSSNIIAKAVKMKPIDARILVSKNVGDKNLMKAYQGLKDISNVIVPHKEIEQKLDIKLKTALEKKYVNSAEVIGNVNLFGMK